MYFILIINVNIKNEDKDLSIDIFTFLNHRNGKQNSQIGKTK